MKHSVGKDTFCVEAQFDARPKTAAIIAEIVQAVGGLAPPQKWWDRIERIRKARGVLLIADEVQTGLGRTGKMFACEHYGLEPEILTGGKGLSGGVGSLAVTAASNTVAQHFFGGTTPTSGGNAVSSAAGLALIETLIDERLVENAAAMGRYFTESDHQHSAMLCFVGRDLVDEFFPTVDPIDKEITVRGANFRIIGVAARIGTTFGQSQDKFVHIPLTTFQKLFVARPQLAVSIQAYDPKQMLVLEDEVRALMRARRHIPYQEDDTFGINASDTLMSAWHQLTGAIFAVTIGIVAVFMVVGGIVIMNIMLASVTERTHEIGIRKSLGARRRDILMQFIIESSVMAATGGAIGVLLSFIISRIVDMVFTSSVPAQAVIIGLVLSTVVGLFFGIYPASKAARLDPIEALRTEA